MKKKLLASVFLVMVLITGGCSDPGSGGYSGTAPERYVLNMFGTRAFSSSKKFRTRIAEVELSAAP